MFKRIKEQENGNVQMWLEDEKRELTVSVVKTDLKGKWGEESEIRFLNLKGERRIIPAIFDKCNFKEENVIRAVENVLELDNS